MDRALQTTLSDLTNWLHREGVPFAVIGGIAVTARGEARFTADIDIVVGLELDAALQFVDRLSASPFRPLVPDVQEIVQKAFLLPLSHLKTNVRVDVAVGLSGFEQQVIARATEVSLGGCLVPIVTAEDLILMKLLAGRPRDTDDVNKIVLRQSPHLNWDYLLETGRQLQQALDQDLLSELNRLRKQTD